VIRSFLAGASPLSCFRIRWAAASAARASAADLQVITRRVAEGNRTPPPHRTGREALASYGSYDPASGITQSCHRTNSLGSRRAMRPSQCIDARSRRRNLLYFRRAHDQVRQRTKRKVPLNTRELIENLNPLLRGWGEYYKRAHGRRLFHRLDGWIVRRIWSHCFKRWHNSRHAGIDSRCFAEGCITATRSYKLGIYLGCLFSCAATHAR
jgi:hypothetical protein